jgi:hypothetical protein
VAGLGSVLKLEVAAVPALAVAAVHVAAGQMAAKVAAVGTQPDFSATTKSISVSHAEHAINNTVGPFWWTTLFCYITLKKNYVSR